MPTQQLLPRRHRFVCRRKIGCKSEMAAYLTPIPVGAVVYGTGDTALLLTQEQAAAFRASGMSQYGELKQRLMTTTALMTLGGTGGWHTQQCAEPSGPACIAQPLRASVGMHACCVHVCLGRAPQRQQRCVLCSAV